MWQFVVGHRGCSHSAFGLHGKHKACVRAHPLLAIAATSRWCPEVNGSAAGCAVTSPWCRHCVGEVFEVFQNGLWPETGVVRAGAPNADTTRGRQLLCRKPCGTSVRRQECLVWGEHSGEGITRSQRQIETTRNASGGLVIRLLRLARDSPVNARFTHRASLEVRCHHRTTLVLEVSSQFSTGIWERTQGWWARPVCKVVFTSRRVSSAGLGCRWHYLFTSRSTPIQRIADMRWPRRERLKDMLAMCVLLPSLGDLAFNCLSQKNLLLFQRE